MGARSTRIRHTLLAAVFLLAGAAGAAQPQQTARSFAAAIDGHYNHLSSLQVQFTQTYDGMGMDRVEKGTLLLSKGGRMHEGKMRWTYTQPEGKLFVLDGKYGYFYTPGQGEVQRMPAKQLSDLRSPLALLLGHAELAKQLDGLTLTPAADGDATLSGVPRGMAKRVSELEVTASAHGVIRKLVIEETDGARNSFTFSNEQPDIPTGASDFVFKPPLGTHVVEGMPPV